AHESEAARRPRSAQTGRQRGADQKRDRDSGHRQGEAPGGHRRGRGHRKAPGQRHQGADGAQGRRQGAVRQVRRQRVQGRRHRVPDRVGEGRARDRRIERQGQEVKRQEGKVYMAKTVTFDVDARQALKKGIDTVAQAVRITLGPKGRNVVLEKKFGAPTVTNDGVTIVREIELKDPMENTGAQLLREVATKTNDVAGDGTTTATLLAQTMISEGFRNVTAGANPMQLKIGIQKAVDAVVDEIKKLSVPVKGHEDVAHVAAISSQSEQIGSLIADAMDKVGKDGVITVEDN